MGYKSIYNAEDKNEAALIVEALNSYGINSYTKTEGALDYLVIKGGMSVFGEGIYVDEADEKKAKEIAKQISQKGVVKSNRLRNYRRIEARAMLIILVLIFVYLIINFS